MGTSVRIDHDLETRIRMLPQVQLRLIEVANQIKRVAQAIAPFKTGHYRDGIEVQVFAGDGKVKVVATDFKSNWIEFGTIHQPPRAPLRIAVAMSGYVLKGSQRVG